MKLFTLLTLLLLTLSLSLSAQTPGLIYHPPGGAGVTPLNPNGDGWTSILTTGYVSNDISESEIKFQPLPVPYAEPTSDLVRGADCRFSDIVRIDSFDSGVYMYSDGTNLMFRFRQGNTTPGSKGYSILIDTDGLFGCCGSNADPNYIPKTTGIDGNPGFEIEIVLETNFQVAMYDIDGIDNPAVPVVSYSVATNHQRSVALTNNCDDPDYFHDFYIVLADMYAAFGITSATPLRYAATTVMAPKPATGGPLSDINGGGSYEDIINYQCGTPIGATATTDPPCSCTNPPAINGPIPSGTNVPITGTWSATSATKPNNATIEVFVNGTSQGTTATTDGAGWGMTLPGPLVNGDTIYATAQATGEGLCDPDPQIIIVTDCHAGNTPTAPTISCIGAKGMKGTTDPNATINIYLYLAPPASPTENLMVSITADATGAWGWNGVDPINSTVSNICTAGSGDMVEGTYRVTAATGNCPSPATAICLDRNGGSYPLSGSAPAPIITTNPIEEGNSDITGTATTGELIRLYINGHLIATTTAAAGVFTFTSISPLYSGDVVEVTAQADLQCESASAAQTVSCILSTPTISANEDNEVAAGSILAGTSIENGATINIYDATAPTVSLGTAVVAGNTWTSAIVAVAGTTYFATVTSLCGTSSISLEVTALNQTPDRCGIFTSTPYTRTTATVSGTLSSAVANTTVYLYADGALLGSTITSTTAWSIDVTGELYPNAILTFSVQEPGLMEFICSVQEVVGCTPLTPTFTVNPTSVTILGPTDPGVRVFTVTGTRAGVLYVLEDAAAPYEDRGVSMFATVTDPAATLDITSFPFTTAGTYNLRVRAMTFDGSFCDAIGSLTVMRDLDLPVELTYFNAKLEGKNTGLLTWQTSSELNNSGYEIEQVLPNSTRNFEFNMIDFVPGVGTTNETQNYSLEVPNLIPGTHYFRLKQVDHDGSFSYSPTRVLSVKGDLVRGLYPTILTAESNSVYIKVGLDGDYNVKLVNALGQNINLFDGPIKTTAYKEISLNTVSVASGIYFIVVSNGTDQFVDKIRVE